MQLAHLLNPIQLTKPLGYLIRYPVKFTRPTHVSLTNLTADHGFNFYLEPIMTQRRTGL